MKNLPEHVAIIMDGNGRWASKRLLPRIVGHNNGVEAVRRTVRSCLEQGIKNLTLFAFSSENWQRPRLEINILLKLLQKLVEKEVANLQENGVSLRVIGDIEILEPKLAAAVMSAQSKTANNNKLRLNIAFNYGGRWDIVQATKKIHRAILNKEIVLEDLSEQTFSQYLSLNDLPDPELLIRTSGEQRISNFLLWQCAYSEIYFTSVLWPDFNSEEFNKALAFYQKRERRFGRIEFTEDLAISEENLVDVKT